MLKILDYSFEEKEINNLVLMREGLCMDIHPSGI